MFTITKQNYFSSSYKLLFDYIVFEFTLLLVVRTRLSENYIATISCTWEWASSILIKIGGDPWLPSLDHCLIESPVITALAEYLVSFLINPVSRCWDEVYLAYFSPQEAQLFRSIPLSNNAMESDYNSLERAIPWWVRDPYLPFFLFVFGKLSRALEHLHPKMHISLYFASSNTTLFILLTHFITHPTSQFLFLYTTQ